MSIVHHVSLGSNEMEKALAFYDAALGALGYRRVMDFAPHAVGYGIDHPEFWIQVPYDRGRASVGNGVHIAFGAASKDQVAAFYEAALRAGGTDDGPPGPRPDYGPAYYGAFVRDLDGNKIEACIVG
ncbi:MAG: VOC family protein [Alphaproteobacteria bacterium]|nr:VOC family protein [Alphaproteobacteria bacterium]